MKKEKKIGKTFFTSCSITCKAKSTEGKSKGKQFSNHGIESQQQIHQSSNGQSFRIALHRMDDFTFTTSKCLKGAFTELDEVCKNCSDRCHMST